MDGRRTTQDVPLTRSPEGWDIDVEIDPDRDVIKLFGVRYDLDLFRGFGVAGLPVGTVVRIVARENGNITLETVSGPPE